MYRRHANGIFRYSLSKFGCKYTVKILILKIIVKK